MSIDVDPLVKAAIAARAGAYAPYSHFTIGAAVLCEEGEIVSGCNIENASYGLTVCAERVALFAAHAAGKRGFTALCVASGASDRFTMPCGACRQVMNEFNPRMLVICVDAVGCSARAELADLLPRAFGPSDLNERGA